MKMKCLIIDDEPVARKGMEEYVRSVDFLQLAGLCENATRAETFLSTESVDLLLLDIHMPGVSGIDFLKNLHNPPIAIFTTAHPEHALEGFSLDVMDYLLKPISPERFRKAVDKAFDFFQLRQKTTTPDEKSESFFFVKSDGKYEKVLFEEVCYVEALQNYVVIHTLTRKLITYITLTSIENQLPRRQFIKVHKSFIVSIPGIQAIEGNELLVGNARIPVSRTLREEVLNIILGNNLLKR